MLNPTKCETILEDKVKSLPRPSFPSARFSFYWKGGASLVDNNQNEKMYEQLKQMLQDMKFGSITLVVQDGKVIQLEKVEKVRIK